MLLIFFFNALLFSYLLLKKGLKEDKRDSIWLAALIFLGGLYICPFMFGYANWYSIKNYREFLFFTPFQHLFLLGPLFFFYVKILLNSKLRITLKDLIHFLPAIIYLIYSLIVFITDKFVLDEFYFYADGKDKDLDFWYQMVGLISMLFYLLMSLKHYLNYRKLSLQEVSFADAIAFTWIKHFILAFALILVLRVLFFISNPEWGQFGRKYWYYLCFSVLMLYISITGYSNTIKAASVVDFEPSNDDKNEAADVDPIEAFSSHEWNDKITHLFETEHVYKNPNLTLTDLAGLLETNRNIISKTINQEFQMNFNDFVNHKRTEAIIARLKKGDHVQNTLLAIALDSGFNSKTTFNRAFKKHTGMTPKQFITANGL